MRRYKYIAVTYATSSEKVEVALTSTPDVKRKVLSIIPERTASVRLRAYIDQDQIVDAPSDLLGAYTDPRFILNRELAVGETLYAGFFDGAASGTTKYVVVEYEES